MKPLVLDIQAFGPFAGAIHLDFNELGDDQLFLISGPTGMGKTTILDAIVYALYGKSSTDQRSDHLRSDYCDPSMPTEVAFTFALGEAKYRITRTPLQELKKQRGEGTRVVSGTVKLERWHTAEGEEPGWQPIASGVREVDPKIEELLGFRYNQFVQVVLLPQGEFRKLLVASSKDRQELLHVLFRTGVYQAIEQHLKADFDKAKAACEDMNAEQLHILQDAGVENLTALQEKEAALVSHMEQVGASVTVMKEKQHTLSQQLEARKQRETLEEELRVLLGERDRLETLQGDMADKEGKCNQYDVAKPLFALRKEGQAAQEQLVRDEGLLTKKQEAKQAALAANEQLLEKETAWANKEAAYKDGQTQLGALQEQAKYWKELAVLEQGYAVALKKVKDIDCQHADEALAREEVLLRTVCEEYHQSQAALLAETLQEGAPCPVCGSCEHPIIAVAEKVTTREAMEMQQERVEKARKQRDAVHHNLDVAKQELAIYTEKIEDKKKALGTEDKTAWESKRKNLEAFLRAYEQEGRQLKTERERCKRQLDTMNVEVASLTGAIEANRTLVAAKKEQFQRGLVEAGLSLDDLGAMKTWSVSLWKQAIQKYKEDVAKNMALLASRQDTLQKMPVVTDVVTADMVSAATAAWEEKNRELGDVKQQLMRCRTQRERYEALESQGKEAKENYEFFRRLYELASGGRDGLYRVNFERYVQSAILEEVVEAANLRLLEMTDKRYTLLRASFDEGGRGAQGLDLEVMDSYTGVARKATTLSGGEMFLASLALSMGLADIIQSYAGGIRLDTMFIDEGFGTLDADTLDTAMKTLIRLQRAGRLVGLISHVEEMKRRIGMHLEVRAAEKGSTASFARR